MAYCKDCLHIVVCPFKRYRVEKDRMEKRCSFFKDHSRFVELPVKPGEKVFYFDTAGRIYESTVTQLVYGATGFLIDSDVMFNSNLIGARFFLTREAAEQALKQRQIMNKEQKYAICRPYDGITLNTEVEFLLDQNGDVMLFDSESAAWEYFKPIGITEEELNAIKVVEYKERENSD